MQLAIHKSSEEVPEEPIRCPRCHSDAVYKYGRTNIGKRRYICQICNRQFVKDTFRREIQDRPHCPKCGKPMHVYKKEAECLRFRCSNYPSCKNYAKLTRNCK